MTNLTNNCYTIVKHIKVSKEKQLNQDGTMLQKVNVINSDEEFSISLALFETFKSGDIYSKVEIINKTSTYDTEGKIKEIGLNEVFNNIGDEVFTVFFRKADKNKTKAEIKGEEELQVKNIKNNIETAIKSLSLSDIPKLSEIIYNSSKTLLIPINDKVEGELRKMRGFKTAKYSSDGIYNIIDIDVEDTNKENYNHRKVNLQNIIALIHNYTLYIRKDLNLNEEKLLKLFEF